MDLWLQIAIAAAISGLIFLDSAAVAQIMISQPIVCAPLIGWIIGDWHSGLFIGTLLALFWIGKLPIGSHVPPEAPISAITATMIYVFLKQALPVPLGTLALAVSICCGIINGFLGGELTTGIRKFNNRFCVLADRYAASGSFAGIAWITLLSIGIIWITASVLIFIGTWLPVLILPYFYPTFLQMNLLEYTPMLLVALGIAVIFDLFKIKTKKIAFVIGLLCGFLILGILTWLFH